MTMPDDLVLVRHGESEGNVAMRAERAGDLSWFTDAYATTPGHRWALTATGIAQARCAGAWLRGEFIDPAEAHFDHYYASPFRRARQTAGHLHLVRKRYSIDRATGARREPVDAQWWLNRALRERDWGDIGTVPRAEFESCYALSARNRRTNPLYWTPPGGESIAHVAENRVRNVLDTLHREASGQRVLAVTHGETMMAFRLVLERLSDEQYEALDADPAQTLPNCAVLHYSRTGPDRSSTHRHLRWLRRAAPELVGGGDPSDPGQWRMRVGDWQPIEFSTYTSADLRG